MALLLKEISGKGDSEACTLLANDEHKKTVAADVLNFFEELAFAVRSGFADNETLKKIHRGLALHYYSVISPWINRIRKDNHQQTAYEHFEWLRDAWK